MKFVVKLAPEITIKSRAVRMQFIQRLCANLRKVLKHRQLHADVVKRWDMIEVSIASKHHESANSLTARSAQIAEALAQTPGIAHYYASEEYLLDERQNALDQIAQTCQQLFAQKIGTQSFAVRCKREGIHEFGSNEVEKQCGAAIFAANPAAHVKLKNPDVTVAIEVKKNRFFISTEKYAGLGGYPIGNVGQVLSLISGGYDSCVASYLAMQRGMQTHFLFFNLGGLAHEVGVKQAAHFLWQRFSASHRTGFVSVPFEHVVADILQNVDKAYRGVVLKRLMTQAASTIANEMQISTLVTGESIAQVSSQTLANLNLIDKATEQLVVRPLITTDKTQIIALSSKIGVDVYAEHMPEYCAIISEKPTTAAKPDRLALQEAKLDKSILDKAIARRALTAIDEIYEQSSLVDRVKQISVPEPNQTIIDIRRHDEIERRPLALINNETLQIPAYKINHEFATLEKHRQYLLYCDRGVISKLHAAHLIEEGFENVGVYAPAS